MSGQSRARDLARYRLLVMAFLGVALAVAGGASRSDEEQQTLVRVAAILAIAFSLWPLDFRVIREHRRLIAAVGAAYLLPLLQLAPMPFELWAGLAGHEVYARIAREAGAVGWRPLSLTPDLTLNSLFALLPATAAGLCALYLGPRGRLWLAAGIVVTGLGSVALGLAQLAIGGDALRLYRETSVGSAVGLFANRNHQAALMACALPLTGALAGLRSSPGADGRITVALALAAAGMLLIGLISTGSRMGLVLGGVGLVGAVACYRAAGHALWPARWPARLAVVGGGAATLAIVALAVARGVAIERLALSDPSSESRIAALGPLVSTARAFLPFGAGFGSFDAVYRRFEPDQLLSTIYLNQAHNEPLQLAIEGGLPALALFGLFVWAWSTSAARATRASGPTRERTMALAAVTITAILMMSSLVDYPLRTPLLGAVFAVASVEMMAFAQRRPMATRLAPEPRAARAAPRIAVDADARP